MFVKMFSGKHKVENKLSQMDENPVDPLIGSLADMTRSYQNLLHLGCLATLDKIPSTILLRLPMTQE